MFDWLRKLLFGSGLNCCCPAPADCCPCTDGDERIVEINFIPTSGTACHLTGVLSQNSAASGCQFNLDGLADGDCQVLGGGSITCNGTSWNLQATTGDGIDPATETEWGPGMTVTINSCDPIDVEFNGPQGQVEIVEQP